MMTYDTGGKDDASEDGFQQGFQRMAESACMIWPTGLQVQASKCGEHFC